MGSQEPLPAAPGAAATAPASCWLVWRQPGSLRVDDHRPGAATCAAPDPFAASIIPAPQPRSRYRVYARAPLILALGLDHTRKTIGP